MRGSVSIITVNYNGYLVTCELIDSLYRCDYARCQIIVVDNGSVEDESLKLQARFPGIQAIRSDCNLGFAGGNNLGMTFAQGEFILLLNNDTIVTANFVESMLDCLDSAPLIGVVCPKIMFEYTPERIQFAGYTPLHRITLRNRLIGFNEVDLGQYDTPGETPYALGAAMLLKKEVIEQVGGIPEAYFLYYEELDWCERIRKAGFKIWYDPGATVYHKESATVGRLGPVKQYYLTRNRMLYAKRNLTTENYILSISFQLLFSLPRHTVSFLLKRRFDLLWATWRGVIHGFKLVMENGNVHN